MSARRRRAALLAAVLGAGVLAPAGAVAGAERRGPAAAPEDSVTLLTGDRVTLAGGIPLIEAGPGREGTGFRTRRDGEGHWHVVPVDVAADVASGRLDDALFDVTGLLAQGYGDAERQDTPLIVTYGAGAQPRAAGTPLPSIGGVAVKAAKDAPFLGGARLAGSGPEKVWLDRKVHLLLDRSVQQIGAPAAWQAGYTGVGVTVAVLDTGVDKTHPDLEDAVVGEADFSGAGNTDDHHGHGTHVASTVTGKGTYTGVAPDAKILSGKVLDDGGNGTASGIIAGMEWAGAAGADVVNISLGEHLDSDGTDPMSLALNEISLRTGALFVTAAGNSGAGRVGSPATADEALAVGAVDRDDALAPFSSHGPRPGDGAVKPEITAPGVDIVAARAKNGRFGQPGQTHVPMSGTSMAAPHVAGAAALLAQQHPGWTARQLKSALTGSAVPHPGSDVHQQGAGRVDAARALVQRVTTSPAVLNLGLERWPHGGQPRTGALAYRNDGSTPVTLALDLALKGPDGAPSGLVALSAPQVTVPAGGTADVVLTAAFTEDTPTGGYSGVLTATGPGTLVRTPVSMGLEAESYTVSATGVLADGGPAPELVLTLVDRRTGESYSRRSENGSLQVRVPKGVYTTDGMIVQTGADGRRTTALFTDVDVPVHQDTAFAFDVRDARTLTARTDQPEARVGEIRTLLAFRAGDRDVDFGYHGDDPDLVSFRPSRSTAPGAALFTAGLRLARPDGQGGFSGSPFQYSLGWTHDGGVPVDLDRAFRTRDLAKVRTTLHGDSGTGRLNEMASGPLPYTVTEYISPGVPYTGTAALQPEGVSWPTEYASTGVAETFAPGQTSRHWFAAPRGPAFPRHGFPGASREYPELHAGRDGDNGDVLRTAVPMLSDSTPNHHGSGGFATARTTLTRGGTVLGTSDYPGYVQAADPGGSGEYRLRSELTREGALPASVSVDWTFRSSPAAPGQYPALPLLAVRFVPDVDARNQSPKGRTVVGVRVDRNGMDTKGVRKPDVQVSYDDGQTWNPVTVRKSGDKWAAVVDHPATARFVSLRAQTSDGIGNAVDQTVVRAYALK